MTGWKRKDRVVHALKCVLKSRPVMRRQNIVANLHYVVRADAEHESIERKVMNCAHRNSVWNYWFAALRILLNVSCLKKFGHTQPTQGALASIGLDDTSAEHWLVKALADYSFRVGSPKNAVRLGQVGLRLPLLAHYLIECQDKLLRLWFLADNPNPRVDEIDSRLDAFEPSHRLA